MDIAEVDVVLFSFVTLRVVKFLSCNPFIKMRVYMDIARSRCCIIFIRYIARYKVFILQSLHKDERAFATFIKMTVRRFFAEGQFAVNFFSCFG